MSVIKTQNPTEKLNELLQKWGELKFEKFTNEEGKNGVSSTGLVSAGIASLEFPGKEWTYEEIHDYYCYFYNDSLELSIIVGRIEEVGEIKNIVDIAKRLRESKEPKDKALSMVLFAAAQTYKDDEIMALVIAIESFGKERGYL